MRNELVSSSLKTIPAKFSTGVHDCPEDVLCTWHYHDEIELLAILEGEKTLWIDETEYRLLPGDTVFINSRVPHQTVDKAGKLSSLLLQFRPDAFSAEVADDRLLRHLSRFADSRGEYPFWIFHRGTPDGDELLRYLIQMKEEYDKQEPFYEIYLQGCIHLLLGFLYRRGLLNDTSRFLHNAAIEKVKPALLYIDDHYAEDISLSCMSDLCGLSEGYFCRRFKDATGSTPVEYLNFVRIYYAEKLLRRTGRPILDISMEVGYSSVSYFNRMFRRFKNCAPNRYRHVQYLREKS